MAECFTVIGGRGFVGSRVVQRLRSQAREVHVLGREDMRVTPTHDLGHVIYAAGLTADFRSRPLDTVEAHVSTLARVLSSGSFASLTYLSSTRVYAGAGSTGESSTLAVNPGVPGDLYNLSKLMGESLCLHGGRVATKVARLSNVVGLRSDPDIFIDQLLAEGLASGGRIRLKTTLDSCKDYIDLDDAADLLIRIALSDQCGIFNLASGLATSNAELTALITQHLGFKIEVMPDAAQWTFEPVDIGRIRSVFGFEPRPFADYFPQFLHQYKLRHLPGAA